MIPERPAEDTPSSAERRLFARLRDDTPAQLTAFHHVAWLMPGARRPEQGEADFVLAHPEHGLLVVEVKGGTISYDAPTGRWTTRGRRGEADIKDPFEQARRSSHSLRRLLERKKRVADNRFFCGYVVAFPDTRLTVDRLKPDAPREIVLDADGLNDLAKSTERLFRYWAGRERQPGLTTCDLEHVEASLANSFELTAPLAIDFAEDERELLRFTEEQYYVLDMLDRHPRAAIAGCAGSGKTFLAAEKARRLADQGFRVLVVCFNRFLAEHLRRGLADAENVDAMSFDALCRMIVREAGISFADEPEPGAEGAFYEELRRLFAENVDLAAGRYGALIADEAQDFREDWWLPLQLLLEHPDESPLYVFFDDNQRIFPVPKSLPVPDAPYELTRNCRNTKTINDLVRRFYKGGTIEALGPRGIPLDPHFYRTEQELLGQLAESVMRWTEEAEVRPEQIALLTSKGAHRSALWKADSLAGIPLTDDPWEAGKILRSTIYKFKGLERLVVAVTELDGARDEVFYVGFSRPNVFLSIFCPEEARHRLPREISSLRAG